MDATPSPSNYDELSLWKKSLVRCAFALLGGISVFVFVIIFVNISFFLLDAFDAIKGRYSFFIPSRSPLSLLVGFIFGFARAPQIYCWAISNYQSNQIFRNFVLGSSFYIICVISFVHIFEPKPFRKGLTIFADIFRYDDQILLLFKLVIYPISIFAIGLYFYSKRNVADPENNNGDL
jgi:hypothetical protein